MTMTRKTLTWANRITLVRLFLTPLVVIGLLQEARWWPLGIFLLAAVTDFLDGAVARWRGEQTVLGKFLDPIADKLLLSATFLVLAHQGVFPLWSFVLVFSRELMILIGWNVIYILTKSAAVEPRWAGKSTTFLQMATVIVALALPLSALQTFVFWAMTLATVVSTGDYVWVGSKKLGELG